MVARGIVGLVVAPRDSLELYKDQFLGHLKYKEHMTQLIALKNVRLSCYYHSDEWF